MTEEKVINIEELTQDEHNFNKGTVGGAELMERSLKELGAGRSILIDKNGTIIAGNKTQEAAIKAGITKVRVIETTGDEIVAVKRTDVDINDAKGRELALVDNLATQVNLAWDEAEIEAMDVEGFDASGWGWEAPEVESNGEAESKTTEYTEIKEDEDFDPDAKYETKVSKGDIWQLGAHRLMCGDSTKAEDVLRLMGEEKADLWLTDPPYNVDYSEKEQYKKDLGYGSTVHEVAIANDKMSNNEFLEFLVNCYAAAKEVMKPGASFYIWHADTEGLNFRIALEKIGGMKLSETLVWVKNQMVFGRQDFHWRHEPCLYGWKLGEGHKWYSDRSQTTVLEFDRPKVSEDHPTMKPVPLFGYQIQCSTKEGDIVFDDFGGSGTTIVACEQLGRKARLMEFEPHYCNVIIARWEKLTGQKAVKVG